MKSIENKYLDLEKNITYNYRIITMQDNNSKGKNYETFRSGWTSSEIKSHVSASNANIKPSYSSSTGLPIKSENLTKIKVGTPAYSQGRNISKISNSNVPNTNTNTKRIVGIDYLQKNNISYLERVNKNGSSGNKNYRKIPKEAISDFDLGTDAKSRGKNLTGGSSASGNANTKTGNTRTWKTIQSDDTSHSSGTKGNRIPNNTKTTHNWSRITKTKETDTNRKSSMDGKTVNNKTGHKYSRVNKKDKDKVSYEKLREYYKNQGDTIKDSNNPSITKSKNLMVGGTSKHNDTANIFGKISRK